MLLLAGIAMLGGCADGNPGSRDSSARLSGNWQFSTSPDDQSFLGGLQGGFLLQKNGTVTGAATYAISLPPASGGVPIFCNGGSAPITGTVSGQNVTLTASAGGQTFTLKGTLSADSSSMTGTYDSTTGSLVPDPTDPKNPPVLCGTAQTGQTWSATQVPPLSGLLKGNFHSASGQLSNQNFAVTGVLTQGENIGASNATVTGTLTFVNQASSYPCFDSASLNGQISGNVVILQIIGKNGTTIGQIGGVATSGVNTVTVDSTPHGRVLHSSVSPGYAIINTKSCPGISLSNPGDFGSVCLSLDGSNACQQPILLTPANLIFPLQSPPQTPTSIPVTQMLGSAATTQTVTVTNNDPSGSTLNGLSLRFQLNTDNQLPGLSDFTGLPNFTEQDTCASSLGTSFSLLPGQSCSVTISFTPQQSCPWLPFAASNTPPSIIGAPPSLCPFPLSATLTVDGLTSLDGDTSFSVPISGYGASAIQASTPELDFGAEAVSQSSLPQTLTFTNKSTNTVQILTSAPCVNPPGSGPKTLPRPLQMSSPVGGLQVVGNGNGSLGNISANFGFDTITYSCDSDPGTSLPNFQISADTCSGALLPPQAYCTLQVSFVPQPNTPLGSGLDYFLQLNTVQCTDAVTSDCEIDSGRFPVELKSNPPSPLRMNPAAGLDFGTQPFGDPTFVPTPLKITLLNDPDDPNSATVNFVGKVVVNGADFSETDDCPFSLAPGASCTIVITFNPRGQGFRQGTITINYTPEPTGFPQTIYLRGMGLPQ